MKTFLNLLTKQYKGTTFPFIQGKELWLMTPIGIIKTCNDRLIKQITEHKSTKMQTFDVSIYPIKKEIIATIKLNEFRRILKYAEILCKEEPFAEINIKTKKACAVFTTTNKKKKTVRTTIGRLENTSFNQAFNANLLLKLLNRKKKDYVSLYKTPKIQGNHSLIIETKELEAWILPMKEN